MGLWGQGFDLPPKVLSRGFGLFQIVRQQCRRDVLIANRPQETADRKRANRCCAKIGRGRVGATVNHGVADFNAGWETIGQNAARFAFQNWHEA